MEGRVGLSSTFSTSVCNSHAFLVISKNSSCKPDERGLVEVGIIHLAESIFSPDSPEWPLHMNVYYLGKHPSLSKMIGETQIRRTILRKRVICKWQSCPKRVRLAAESGFLKFYSGWRVFGSIRMFHSKDEAEGWLCDLAVMFALKVCCCSAWLAIIDDAPWCIMR